MKKLGIVYNPIYADHRTGRGHPETHERVLQTIELLKKHDMYGEKCGENFISVDSRKATLEEISWVHSKLLIDRVKQAVTRAGDTTGRIHMDGDTLVSKHSFDAALRAVGGNFAAIDAIFERKINRAFILCRPPGHHTNTNASRGFCLFNNVALGCNYLFRKKNINKIAIVDFDVHAGNGTEEIFWDGTGMKGKDVLMISTHQNPSYFYPGTGFVEEIGGGSNKGKIVNIPFERHCGDQSMAHVLREIIGPLLNEFEPEFIYFSAGFDAHYRDPVGGLNFTAEGYGNIVQFLEPISEKFSEGRFAFTLEGGYNIGALGRSIVNILNVSVGGSILYFDNHIEPDSTAEYTAKTLIPLIKETLKPYWNCFT